MHIKDKLVDAYNKFPYGEHCPAVIYSEALDKIVCLEEALLNVKYTLEKRDFNDISGISMIKMIDSELAK